MATDPVCKMSVSEKDSKYTSTYQDKSQWFCSAECKSKFDQGPEKYKIHIGDATTTRKMKDDPSDSRLRRREDPRGEKDGQR